MLRDHQVQRETKEPLAHLVLLVLLVHQVLTAPQALKVASDHLVSHDYALDTDVHAYVLYMYSHGDCGHHF